MPNSDEFPILPAFTLVVFGKDGGVRYSLAKYFIMAMRQRLRLPDHRAVDADAVSDYSRKAWQDWRRLGVLVLVTRAPLLYTIRPSVVLVSLSERIPPQALHSPSPSRRQGGSLLLSLVPFDATGKPASDSSDVDIARTLGFSPSVATREEAEQHDVAQIMRLGSKLTSNNGHHHEYTL